MIRFVQTHAQHVGARQNQQDSLGFSDEGDGRQLAHGGFVAVVADGMGGLAYGDEASQQAVKAFLETYATKAESEPIPEALVRALQAANSAVYDLAIRASAPGEVGTTLIAIAVRPEGLHWISVGDSAIYLQRDGALTLLTTSHTYGRTLDALALLGQITAEQARDDPQRESLTSYVGTLDLSEFDRNVEPLPVRMGDSILLASDGLFKTLAQGEIAATLEADRERAADVLVQKTLARKRAHQDNVTVCLVRVEEDKPVPEVIPAAPVPDTAPAATPQPDPDGADQLRRKASRRRLVYLFATAILFGAAASFIGWMIVR